MNESQSSKDERAIPLKVDFPVNPFKNELLLGEDENEVEELTCPICQNLVWNPVHCSVCTNLICKVCIDQWLQKSKKCPMCNSEFISNNLVNLVKNRLSRIKSKCYFSTTDCNQIIPYYDYEKHIKKCDSMPHKCGFMECNVVASKPKVLLHYDNCEYNQSECPACKVKIKQKFLEVHMDMCEITCNKCLCKINARSYKKHSESVFECINLLKNINKVESLKLNQEINLLKSSFKVTHDKLQMEIKELKSQIEKSVKKEVYELILTKNSLLENQLLLKEKNENLHKAKEMDYLRKIELLTSENKLLNSEVLLLTKKLEANEKQSATIKATNHSYSLFNTEFLTSQDSTTTAGKLSYRYLPKTSQIDSYDWDNKTSKLLTLSISSLVMPYMFFWENSATLNYNNNFYISGGDDCGVQKTHFLKYESSTKTLTRLADMIEPKSSHSLIYHNDNIFSVGGFRTLGTEKYSLSTKTWIFFSNLNVERKNPLLYSRNKFIYCFFGYKQGSYLDSVERINADMTWGSKWEILPTLPSKKDVLLGRIFSGIAVKSESDIIIIGGKNINGTIKTSIRFDFDKNSFLASSYNLSEPLFFKESLLLSNKDKQQFGQFGFNDTGTTLKCNFSTFYIF